MSSVPQRRVSQTHSSESRQSNPQSDPSPAETTGLPQAVDHNTAISLSSDQQEPVTDASSNPAPSEKKKCWICLAEEGEIGTNGRLVNPGRWSKACACSLDAHESCLITWINQSRQNASSTVFCHISSYLLMCSDDVSSM